MKFDWMVVGAGFTGAAFAERMAAAGKKVLVIDSRAHVGGNAYDCKNEHGILVHRYGPHIFHTNAKRIIQYLSRFTDWRFYDSIYTERYMMSPQNNRQGYADTDMPASAANLTGKLLLIHGGIDDNVHLQNTLRLAYALQKADKQFELMIYPTARHGLSDQRQILHWYTMMTEFLDKNL